MGLNGKQLLENFKEDEAYGNTTYTPPADEDSNDDNAWKYISAGDISGLADYTNRNYNYRTIPFLGQIVGHAADAATQGVADVAQFVGAQGVGDYLNEKAQKGEAELPAMSTPELSLAYLTDPNGLASAFGMMAGSMLSTAPVAAIAPELLPARAAMALSKVPKALSAVPKIGGALEEMAPMAGRFALTGPVEAMMEGGNTEREMLQNGATPEEARQAAWDVFGENVGLLTATNALEGGLLGKIKIKTPHFSNPVVNTASRVAGYVPTTAAEMALQGYEEGAQQGIQNGVEGESPNTANQILNPFAWTDDQWDAAKLGLAGAVPLMGAMGAIRHFGNRGDNGSTAADSLLDQAQDDIDSITSQTAQQSVIQSAQQDMENNPYTAPTAMQDTPYEAPSDTSDTSSGASYDASALEGDPNYTVSGEVSSTDVTPLTDQKMRLLDSAYYNKYGQHLYITSMKRNGNPDESWHNSGQAFDTADDNLENNKEARDWLISEGEKLGLTPLDEYEHPSAKATGGHIHFSDHGEPIPDGIRVGESDSDMDDNDTDDSTGGVDLSNLPVGDIAMAIAQNTNLPVNFIWSQLSHESDGGKSKLAVEDHNYGGVKGNDGEYLHFDNDQQFIDYMSRYYPKYREDGIYDAQTADQFAEALQHGGYFTADLGEYEGGMHRYLEQAGLSQDAMSVGKTRQSRGSKKNSGDSGTPDISGSFDISADDPAMDSMFASFAKDWQNMSTDANEINFFGDMFNSRNKFKATEENKQAILDSYGDAFRQYVQDNQPQTVQATQTAQAPAQPKQAPQPQHIEMQTPNLQTITTPKVEATTIQNVLSSFVQDKKNVARTEQEANLFDDMLDADDHFIDTPKNRQTLLKNYGAQLQDYVDDAMTPSLTDRVNQAIEQAVQNKDLNRMNTLTQAKQANDTAALEKLVGPQTKQHVDIAAMLTPANTDMKNHVSSTVQANAPVYQTATMEHQAPQTEVASTVQGNVPVNQVAATEDEQKAFRKAGLVYRDSNYNGTERVKTAPLYEEGDRRMNGGKSETKVKAQTAGKADKYKKDAEKIYLRFKSGKFSTEDSIKQLNNLKKKATSDKALSDEDRADVIAEADKHINRIKPQKETKEHETQKHNSKTAKTTQSGEAEGYPHQDAEPEKGRTDAEESEVKASSHFDTSDFKHTKTGEMIPAAKISSKVDADTYKAINSIAKKHGGYYNRYAKRFLFNKGGADGRDAFVEEAERSVFNGADSGTKENTPPVSAGVKRYKNAIDKIKKQYDDGEIDIDEYDNRFFALGDKWLRDAHLTDEDKKEVAAYSDKIDAAVEAEETRREKTRYDFIKKAAKSYAAAKPQEKDDSIFGSVEDADKEMLDALGISEDDLTDDVLTAPDGIENTAEEREKLEKELAAELNKLSANPVFNPKIYTLGLKLAMTYVKDGINTVKKLVAKLNATFGDKIGPWAPALAETVRTWPKGVPFDEKKVMAVSKAVGARYEGGITTLDDMQADMKKLLKGQHKSFAPMIEASYNGIKKFFDEKEAQSHGDESRQEKSESTDAGREGQQSATSEGAGEGGAESRNVSGAEGGESKISRGRDSGSAERENPEGTESSGVRAGTELEETAGNGTRKRGTEKPVLTEAQKNPSPEETPGHDYEIKPSKTKKTPAVRFKQNIAAIKLLKQLEAENRMPTPKEQAILGNYNGWGGLKDAFLDTKENKELRAVLTPEEYEAAKSTINDAFYTPADIVQTVWKGVSRLGFNGGRVLDPSMGTGNFFGCMPRDMMKKSSLRGIEIDGLTSRFARMLYPSALVEHTGFEKASLADNFYDLVISNIPFDANHSIAGYKIHNYFFAHGMDKVRPGGLMVYITSQGSLTNSQDGARMREYIGKKADMVAAYKLPSGAFGESGTNVGTDIVIFRKRGENEMKPSYAQDFQHLTKMFTQTNWRGDTYGGVTVNKYFKDHPENIIGKASSGRDQYGNDVMQVKPNEGANIAKDLAKAMNKLPKDIYKPINRTGKGPFDTIKANLKARADEKTRDFEYYEKDGKVYQNQDGTAVEIGAGNKLKRLKGYLKVKNALNSLMLAEMDSNAKESTVDKLRKQLNTAYDAFVKQNGYLNDPTVQRAYIDDPSAGMVMALEKVEYTGIGAKKKIKSVEKMGIFKERAIAPIQEVKSVKTPNDALIVSLRNKGGVDLPYMAQLMGSNPETVVAGLEGQIFKNPVTEAYETRDEYLSGNVREKLAQAENAAAQDPSYQKNVDELKKVIPKDLIADEICVTMGAPWIPDSDVQAFANHITGRSGALSIKFIPSGAKWIVDGYGSSSKYKTQGISLANLLSDILNNKAIEVYSGKGKERRLDQAATDAANVVAADMKEDFTSWLWSDKDRTKRLTRYYNDNYNNTVLREYDGSHLVFDGMNEKIQLRPHQKNVVWRMLQGGNTLIAHCVGAGKTFEMQAAGMEMRRLGIANKPLYILPNNVVEQFTKEFRQLYPDANLLALQNDYKSRPGYIPAVPKSTVEQTIKREDGRKETITIPFSKLSTADRKKVIEARAMRTRTLTQIRTGDWDGIIMSHSQFERLPLSPETAGSIIREQLDEVEQAIVEAKNGNVGKKDLSTIENQKKKLEDKLKDILKTDLRDIGIPFEQLGVDQIFVDEADMFKNLHYTTSMDRVNGLPNSNANRSMDMYAKTRWLTNANNGRGVVFATGTPVSNTMAEMYTMMRYLDFRGLKEKGLNLFDNWLRTFGEIGSGIERNPSGNGFRKVTKVLRFINMPELTKMFRKFADVKTQDDLDLDIPDLKNGKPTIVKIAPDPVLTDYIRNVVPKRIAAMAKRREDMHKGSDNMLKLTGDLRKMSITDSKIDALADAVVEKYEDTSDVKGAQLVFCDQGIPKAEKDNATDNLVEEDDKDAEADNAGVYKKIITALQERGIPENQIVFIQSAKNKAQMDAIFEKVDKGDIRILIGSTQKMGAGTNCQHHLVALHDLDAPWRPRDLEQRHGRILRQGNPNKEVEIFNYVLQDSFDAVMWEKLKNKAAIVAQAMSNNMQQRTVEDADLVTLTYADAENAGTSDPLVKERITLDSEIKKYKHAQVAFNRKVSTAEATLETAPKEIGLLKSAIEKIKGDIAARQDTSGDNFRMTISGKEYVERKAAQEELGKVLARLSSKTSVKIGEIGGFDVKAYVSGDGEAHIQLVRGRAYMANTATVRGIESALHKAPETMLKAREIELSRNENNLKEAKEIVGQKNPYAEKLAAMEKRFKEINRQIEDNLLGNAKKEETEAPNEETSYSAEEESGAQERALSDIKQEVASAFPNAKNVRDNGHEVLFSMPNGAEILVSIVPSIEATESEERNARAAHGLVPEVHVKINGKEHTVGSKAIIELSQLGRKGTAYHEAFHAVYDMCLTDKEKAALHKAYDKEAEAQGRDTYEVMADKYRDWMIAKQKGQHTLYGKLWQKIKDAAARLAHVVRGTDNAGDVFRKVASGEAWERPYNEVESDTRYAAEQKGARSFIKAAASKLGKRMGVKSDKIITEEAKAKEGIGILDYLIASPSRVATRVKSFRQFYRMGVRAMDVLTERRSYYQCKLGKAMKLVKSKNDYEELTDILLSGDAEGKEWTKEELIQSGTKENIAEAYTRIRRLMRQAYKMVNEAHKHPKTYSKRLSNSKIEELRQNPFVKIMKIHDEEDDGRRLVTYREFANYEHTLEGVTKQALDGMRVDEDMQVLEATKQADGTYKVRVREGRGDVTNRKGYIPHFFHNYMVEVRDEDGNYVTTITSGRTQREAVKKAEEWMKDNKLEDGQKIYIHPKIFDFTRYGMSEKGIVQLGDKDFYALMNRVAKDNDMSLEEAKNLLQNVHQKNRHRFFGNVLHRKGVSGFETDMNYVLSHYFNSASRYYAMETEFKPQAISLYERLFGDFAKDSKNSLAQYVKDYINDVNGTPSALERGVNDALMRSKVYRDFVVSHYGERAVLQLSSNIAGATTYMCLGYFNVSSALLNLTQVMNSAAYIGDVSALGKCLSKGMHRKYSLHDLKVLKETNVLNDIGLDSGSGYDVNRMSAKNLLGKINKAGMSLFKVSEQTVRIGTVLAAYESGIKRGMSHEEAIDFAKEVNQKSNFDYSVADAPNIFRRGSFFSQLALQFKKYGIKELEVMADMCSPRTSRKQKLIFWGTYLLAAGLCGLPALDWLDPLLALVTGIKSPKLAAQAAIMEAAGGTPMGKFIGRMAMYGLPSSLVGVDLSSRVGMSDVVPTELKNLLPPLATKIPQFMQDIFSEAKINAIRDFSPAIYNQIAAWGTGKSYDKRGRINAEYNTFYDKLLRSIGFKSTDERVDSDIRRITSERRSELTKKKQEAVDAYIAHPTPQNMQKLKDLGVKDSTVKKERERKKEDSYNRTKGGMTKKEAQENQQLLNFK